MAISRDSSSQGWVASRNASGSLARSGRGSIHHTANSESSIFCRGVLPILAICTVSRNFHGCNGLGTGNGCVKCVSPLRPNKRALHSPRFQPWVIGLCDMVGKWRPGHTNTIQTHRPYMPTPSRPTVETVGYVVGMPVEHDAKKHRPHHTAPRLKPWAMWCCVPTTP